MILGFSPFGGGLVYPPPNGKFPRNFGFGGGQIWKSNQDSGLGKLEPPPNEKFPRNSPFGGGSAGPPPNGKFPGNFPFDFRKKV